MNGQHIPASNGRTHILRIGRSPQNDIVLDYPMISWEHARTVEENGVTYIEDLNSRNGVAINRVENRIRRATLLPTDSVFFGSYKLSARQLMRGESKMGEAAYKQVTLKHGKLVIGRDPDCDQPLAQPIISWHHTQLLRTADGVTVEDLASRNGTFVDGVRISGRVSIAPGQEIGVGSYRFQLLDDGSLARRNYHGNTTFEAAGVTVDAPNGTRLLDPVSLSIYPFELTALMGPSGAGKSTFLETLNGYDLPTQGHVFYNGKNLYQYYDLFRQQIGYVPPRRHRAFATNGLGSSLFLDASTH